LFDALVSDSVSHSVDQNLRSFIFDFGIIILNSLIEDSRFPFQIKPNLYKILQLKSLAKASILLIQSLAYSFNIYWRISVGVKFAYVLFDC